MQNKGGPKHSGHGVRSLMLQSQCRKDIQSTYHANWLPRHVQGYDYK
ncbi:hypothetical protein DsansV1_C03g0034211 [Dioscorea sansibarensis]